MHRDYWLCFGIIGISWIVFFGIQQAIKGDTIIKGLDLDAARADMLIYASPLCDEYAQNGVTSEGLLALADSGDELAGLCADIAFTE